MPRLPADTSPACIKLLAFLRMVGVEYEYVPAREHHMLGAPKAKIPFVWHKNLNGGKKMGDSQFVIDALLSTQSFRIQDPDAALTPEQHAIGMAVRCMLEESLYFGAIIQMRWGVARSFWGITLDAYFKDLLPNPLRCRDQAEGGEVVVSN